MIRKIKSRDIIRVLLFWILGLLNSVFLKHDDIGSWKNYLGFLFLFIAIVDTIMIISKKYDMKKLVSSDSVFMKVFFFLNPFYLVFHPYLNNNQTKSKTKSLWILSLSGFLFYSLGFVAIYILKA